MEGAEEAEDSAHWTWLVEAGQTVARGDLIAVVETDKGAIEVEVWAPGKVVELLVARAEGVSVEELANRTGLTEGALKMRLMRARKRLRERLTQLRSGNL